MAEVNTKRITRIATEIVVVSALLWWLPLWYQFGGAVALSICLEIGYPLWQKHNLRNSLTPQAIKRMANNVDQHNQEKTHANS
jgi:hypothetical protein